MKWVALSALSEKSTPLLARMPTGIAHDPGEAGDQGRAVEGLELAEAAAVHDARDHLAHVVGLARVPGDDRRASSLGA